VFHSNLYTAYVHSMLQISGTPRRTQRSVVLAYILNGWKLPLYRDFLRQCLFLFRHPKRQHSMHRLGGNVV